MTVTSCSGLLGKKYHVTFSTFICIICTRVSSGVPSHLLWVQGQLRSPREPQTLSTDRPLLAGLPPSTPKHWSNMAKESASTASFIRCCSYPKATALLMASIQITLKILVSNGFKSLYEEKDITKFFQQILLFPAMLASSCQLYTRVPTGPSPSYPPVFRWLVSMRSYSMSQARPVLQF